MSTSRSADYTAARDQLGVRLHDARRRAGLTQTQVIDTSEARALRLHRSSLSDIERGRRDVTALELATLASLYATPITALLGELEQPDNGVPLELAAALRRLSEHDAATIIRFAQFLVHRQG